MSETTNRLDRTLVQVMGDAAPTDIANAVGVRVSALSTTRLGSIDANQLRALCVALHVSADQLIGTDHSGTRAARGNAIA